MLSSMAAVPSELKQNLPAETPVIKSSEVIELTLSHVFATGIAAGAEHGNEESPPITFKAEQE